jgi:hypothetical protein
VIEIHAAPFSLERILSDEFTFAIPPYQRPFAWREEEAAALLTDFLHAMGQEPTPLNKISPYFLGAIVIDQSRPGIAQLVDGQQRITTLTILFAALRHLSSGSQKQRFSALLRRNGDLGNAAAARLTLRRKTDTDFLRKFILAENGLTLLANQDVSELPDTQQGLAEVARYFLKELQARPPQQRKRLADFALTHCILVVVGSADRDTSFTTFTVLNKRGLDLSPVDILKADIVGEITNSNAEIGMEYAETWESLEELLGREGFADLISAMRSIKRPQRPEYAILTEFRTHVIGQRHGKQLVDFVDQELVPLGRALHTVRTQRYYLHGADAKTVREINRLFGWLNRLAHTEWTPVAIEYLHRHSDKPEALVTFFASLERLGVYLMLHGFNAEQRAPRYYRLLKEMADDRGKTSFEAVNLTAEERQDLRKRLDGDIYNRHTARRYLLLRLDDVISGGTASYQDSQPITIEHVLPQTVNPGSPWLTAWHHCWADKTTRREWVHRLANLVLLYEPMNGKSANYDFATKKRIYFPAAQDELASEGQAPFVLTGTLRQLTDWSLQTLTKRQADFMRRLDELWQLKAA